MFSLLTNSPNNLKFIEPETKTPLFKKEFSQTEIEERRKSALELLEYIAKFPCFYKNKLFTRFFEESEIKIDRQVLSREEMLRNLNRNTDFFSFDSNEQNNNSTSSNLNNSPSNNPNSFPVPFQHLQDNQSQENLDKKFKATADPRQSGDSSANKESNDCYLVDACHLICQGQSSEERQEYESAFESYKCAVSIMLKGVKHEKDRAKKLNVRKKVEKYLGKAEAIYDQHLTKEERSGRKFSLDTPYKQIMKDELASTEKNALSKYKLLSISNKVQIVYDLQLNEKFAIKVVHKISNLSSMNRRFFIFPRQIPSMVQLYQIYESEHAYFLILEYLNCSRLSDIVDQISRQLSPCVECLFDDPAEQLTVSQDEEELEDIDDLEEILFDKDRFNEDEDVDFYQLNRSDSVKTLSEIEDDLLNYQNPRSKLVASRSEQKLSGLAYSRSTTDFKSDFKSASSTGHSTSKPANSGNKSTPFNALTGIFDRARNLIKNVDQTIRNTAIDQAKLSVENINLQCNLNNYILERINDKLLNTYYCDRHLNKQLSDCETLGKMLFTEEMVKRCLYEIIVALENLHDQGVLYITLNPSKILVSEDLLSVSLAYKHSLDYKAIAASENLDPANISQLIRSSFYSTYSSSTYSYYIAPELFVCGFEISPAVDWYSFGCLTYELLTNKPLCSLIPSINCKNLIQFPSYLPIEAKDLIEKLLQINPSERLNTADAVKSHVFFKPL